MITLALWREVLVEGLLFFPCVSTIQCVVGPRATLLTTEVVAVPLGSHMRGTGAGVEADHTLPTIVADADHSLHITTDEGHIVHTGARGLTLELILRMVDHQSAGVIDLTLHIIGGIIHLIIVTVEAIAIVPFHGAFLLGLVDILGETTRPVFHLGGLVVILAVYHLVILS